MQLFNERIGLPEQYQPGRPVPLVAYGLTRKVTEDMDPFVVRVRFVPTSTTPSWTRPATYVYAIGLLAEYQPPTAPGGVTPPVQFVELEEIGHNELPTRLSSQLIPPTLRDPVAVFGAGQMEVYPAGVPAVSITYLRYPVVGKWVGTLTNGRLVYNPLTSVQPQWPRSVWNNLAIRAGSFLGINLKAQDMVQYTEMKKQQGT